MELATQKRDKPLLGEMVDQDDGLDHLRADVTGSMAKADPNDPSYLGKIDSGLTALGHIDKMGANGASEAVATPAPAPKPAMSPMPETPTDMSSLNAPAMGAPKKPSVLGRIGHVAARMGNIAGDILAPGVMAITPGTDLYKRIQEQGKEERSERQRKLATEETVARADTEKAAADTLRAKTEAQKESFLEKQGGTVGKTPEELTVHDLMTGNNGQPRVNPETKQPYTYLEAYTAVKKAGSQAKPTTQEQNKLAFQDVVGKLDAARLPTGPKDLDKSLDKALARHVITPQDHETARAYQAANPTPGTSLTVHIAGQQEAQALKDARTHYLYSDANGTTHMVTGDKVPAGVDAVPVKDPQTFISEAQNANIVQKSFSKLAQDDLSIFDSPAARAVLATALSETEARSLGILVAGTGGSISMPAGSGKIIDQFLENNAVPAQLRGAVKTYIADYWAMKDKMLMVQMAMQNGKMGRGNKAYFDAMVAQIPGPGTADSTMAKRQISDFTETLNGLKQRYPDSFGNYRKEPDLGGGAAGGTADDPLGILPAKKKK